MLSKWRENTVVWDTSFSDPQVLKALLPCPLHWMCTGYYFGFWQKGHEPSLGGTGNHCFPFSQKFWNYFTGVSILMQQLHLKPFYSSRTNYYLMVDTCSVGMPLNLSISMSLAKLCFLQISKHTSPSRQYTVIPFFLLLGPYLSLR